MSKLVFVFGTLKEGFPNFATNKGARVGGSFITVECYPLYLVGERFSPWLIHAAGEGERVVDQVFKVDQTTLKAMDVLERITEPDGYRRVAIDVEALEDASKARLSVHAYVKDRELFRRSDARFGPLREYAHVHAALYRSRVPPPQCGSLK
jgi:gamma-glutamylaminecyclotransferase